MNKIKVFVFYRWWWLELLTLRESFLRVSVQLLLLLLWVLLLPLIVLLFESIFKLAIIINITIIS